ncbi:uncharacterized protein CEXT_167861 [Caerostris extrusa]|uniref:Ras association domain-containing protein n=1 Tax=Caerostris extrusa TaxID=172846 RepID=A0AAV4MYH1_CAEEX|nr:uncharacterized protein CEXT_167861 [Caerostris extrusa]
MSPLTFPRDDTGDSGRSRGQWQVGGRSITPDTKCQDVIECCREPSDEMCALVQTTGLIEQVVPEDTCMMDVLNRWETIGRLSPFIFSIAIPSKTSEIWVSTFSPSFSTFRVFFCICSFSLPVNI